MTSHNPILLGLALALAISGSGQAQTTQNHSQDARLAYLRKDDQCQAYIGAFMSVTDDKWSPSAEDKALLAAVLGLTDRIIYDAHKLGEQVGVDAATEVAVQVTTEINQRSRRFDNLPPGAERAAALRADLAPDIQKCVELGEVLEKPPK